jgi:organic radical activating enzyme
MFGKNPKRAPAKGDGLTLDVQEIFPTFQGEGIYTGWPAVFIRLGGCNLACHFCDTEFESPEPMALAAILEQVAVYMAQNNPKTRLVVITGGEPFRQPIEVLCNALCVQGYKVQIECNGTLYRDIPKEVDIVCSPKNTGNGYQRLREDMLSHASALKFIISAADERYNHVGEVGQGEYGIPVYVQPMDEYDPQKNAANLAFTLELAKKYGYRISLQTHKILEIA